MTPFLPQHKIKLIISCEHATSQIPDELKHLFLVHADLLTSHRGYDIGAVNVARNLKDLADNYTEARFSRLVIDLNRSTHHRNLFSVITKLLQKHDREHVINEYYLPYRNAIYQASHDYIAAGFTVLHLSIHSFATILDQRERHNDIGLLFDPKRLYEKAFVAAYRQELLRNNATFSIRYNYPYLGVADGLTTYMRKLYPYNQYIGIEIEMNQKIFQDELRAQQLTQCLRTSLSNLLPNRL